MTTHDNPASVKLEYAFMGGWMRCQSCGRTLALVAPDKPKRHRCDPSLPDQEWRNAR